MLSLGEIVTQVGRHCGRNLVFGFHYGLGVMKAMFVVLDAITAHEKIYLLPVN